MQVLLQTKSSATFASRLDVRVKLCLCAAGSLSIAFFSSPLSLGILLAGSLCLAFSAAKKMTVFRVVLFTFFMNCITLCFVWLMGFFVPDLMRWDVLSLSSPYLRILIISLLLLSLAISTPIQKITAKLQSVKIPGFIYIPLAIAIRFIPTFMADCRQIRDAARLRPGSGMMSFIRGILIPLIFKVLSSADDLAVAAELKGIHAQAKLPISPRSSFAKKDRAVFSCASALIALAFVCQIFGPTFSKVMP